MCIKMQKQGKSSFGHMAAKTNQFLTLFKISRCHKISPLNVFPLKFAVQFLCALSIFGISKIPTHCFKKGSIGHVSS